MWRTVILIILVLAATLPVQAESKKAKDNTFSQKESRESLKVERRAAFSPAERNLIRTVLLERNRTVSQQHGRDLPYGLQKKIARGKTLPPGWQKKVAPGYSLDYHIYRQGESLPDILLHRLAPPPVGSEILRIENKIIRLNSATRTILDVFDLIPRD
ncbi:MAG: hypothetical protein RQ722_07045 [Desulfuromonadales bacterium]|nr:hypothetical protein [Desulfuromonadales bacterium]